MNYFEFWISDYQGGTADLSLAEHGAYLKLMLHYYKKAKPLPAEFGALYKICAATTPDEQEAVRKVADEFFPIDSFGVRSNQKCNEVCTRFETKSDKGRANARKRWGSDASSIASSNASGDARDDAREHASAMLPQPSTLNPQPFNPSAHSDVAQIQDGDSLDLEDQYKQIVAPDKRELTRHQRKDFLELYQGYGQRLESALEVARHEGWRSHASIVSYLRGQLAPKSERFKTAKDINPNGKTITEQRLNYNPEAGREHLRRIGEKILANSEPGVSGGGSTGDTP